MSCSWTENIVSRSRISFFELVEARNISNIIPFFWKIKLLSHRYRITVKRRAKWKNTTTQSQNTQQTMKSTTHPHCMCNVGAILWEPWIITTLSFSKKYCRMERLKVAFKLFLVFENRHFSLFKINIFTYIFTHKLI